MPLVRYAAAAVVALYAALAAGMCVHVAAQAPPGADLGTVEAGIDTAPVEVDGQVLFRVRGSSSMPAETRAANIQARLQAIGADPALSSKDLRVNDADGVTWITAGGRPIMGITDADARLEGLTRSELAITHRARLQQALDEYRAGRSPEALRRDLRDALIALLACAAGIAVVLLVSRWGDRLLARAMKTRAAALEIQSASIVRAERVYYGLHRALHVVTGLLLLALLFEFARFALGRFPNTRSLANRLFSLVVTPLGTIGQGFIDQIPNLVFLAVLFVVFRVALRLLRAVFDALERGAIRWANFEPEWAIPTYKIVRTAMIAFGLVVAYPYLPGSDSAAFKSVSLFVGVLFSLGSSSAIANLIAGYMLIYRRAFRVGDRVKIGDLVGDVTESKLQVTRLRSLKNEEIVVPNLQILSSQVVNYSTLARTQGLILHTEVGIGYETPWRQVEAMLVMAAERTPGVLQTPPPFVLQRALADFAVTYELNVYSDRADRTLELYHELHRQILDVFNEYGVQIMTPAYMGDPTQPKVVPPSQWHLAPARATDTERAARA